MDIKIISNLNITIFNRIQRHVFVERKIKSMSAPYLHCVSLPHCIVTMHGVSALWCPNKVNLFWLEIHVWWTSLSCGTTKWYIYNAGMNKSLIQYTFQNNVLTIGKLCLRQRFKLCLWPNVPNNGNIFLIWYIGSQTKLAFVSDSLRHDFPIVTWKGLFLE